MIRKKSKFLTFILSFIPGAGEMYMGFMKMGVSLMGFFMAVMAVAFMLNIGPMLLFGTVVWFYGFFHANNLYGMRDEEFYALEDDYLFHIGRKGEYENLFHKYRNLIAALLIFLGACLIWNNLIDALVWTMPEYIGRVVRNISYRIPQIVVGIGIVAAGVLMIRGKKRELTGIELKEDGGVN